jgi:hypothetical protein
MGLGTGTIFSDKPLSCQDQIGVQPRKKVGISTTNAGLDPETWILSS